MSYVTLFGKRYTLNPPYRTKDMAWVGFDLDSTLALFEWDKWLKDETHIGPPIPEMVEKLKAVWKSGVEPRIFTARVGAMYYKHPKQTMEDAVKQFNAVKRWCKKNFNKTMKVTAVKDYSCLFVVDDASLQVIPDSGRLLIEDYNLLAKGYDDFAKTCEGGDHECE